jgi:hypothetical protein
MGFRDHTGGRREFFYFQISVILLSNFLFATLFAADVDG